MKLAIIVAAAENYAIGANNTLLWHLPNDMKWFRSHTTGCSVIMGRKTYESLGRPLPNRRNIVVTRQKGLTLEGCEVVESIDEALTLVAHEEVAFVIGGAEIYHQVWSRADILYLTVVHASFEGDVFIPEVDAQLWKQESREDHLADERHAYAYSFVTYSRKK